MEPTSIVVIVFVSVAIASIVLITPFMLKNEAERYLREKRHKRPCHEKSKETLWSVT